MWPKSLCSAVCTCCTTSVCNCKPTLLGGDVKCITWNFWQVAYACAYVICQVLPSIKVCVMHTPCFFEARQLCTKGHPRSLTLDPCWVPCHSTFNKCVWVILLSVPLYTRMSPSVPFLLKYIWYTELCRHALVLGVQRQRAFWWGKWSRPLEIVFCKKPQKWL